MSQFRLGYGEDIHRLVEGRKLILGGIEIPFEKGLLGHSDADCLLHALMDSLLGALALGDIGLYFPPDDPEYEGADSTKLLAKVKSLVDDSNYAISNVDLLLFAEQPKLKPYRESIRSNIANLLDLDISQVGFQAMSNEGLDAVGRGEAIRAVSTVLLERKDNE